MFNQIANSHIAQLGSSFSIQSALSVPDGERNDGREPELVCYLLAITRYSCNNYCTVLLGVLPFYRYVLNARTRSLVKMSP